MRRSALHDGGVNYVAGSAEAGSQLPGFSISLLLRHQAVCQTESSSPLLSPKRFPVRRNVLTGISVLTLRLQLALHLLSVLCVLGRRAKMRCYLFQWCYREESSTRHSERYTSRYAAGRIPTPIIWSTMWVISNLLNTSPCWS